MSGHYFSPEPESRPERGIVSAYLRGRRFSFVTAAGVFSHRSVDKGTRLLVESMELPRSGALLDLGCGYGVLGVVAAALEPGLRVTMTDVNRRAAGLARENVAAMRLSNAEVLEGSLYEPVAGRRFTTIVSNPPVSAGMRRVVWPLVSGAADHLGHGGLLQMVVQSNKGGRTLAGFMDEAFGGHEVAARGSGYRVLAARKG